MVNASPARKRETERERLPLEAMGNVTAKVMWPMERTGQCTIQVQVCSSKWWARVKSNGQEQSLSEQLAMSKNVSLLPRGYIHPGAFSERPVNFLKFLCFWVVHPQPISSSWLHWWTFLVQHISPPTPHPFSPLRPMCLPDHGPTPNLVSEG